MQKTRRLSTTLVVLPKIVISGHAGKSESIAPRLVSGLFASHDRCKYLKYSALLQEVAGIEVEVNAASLPLVNPNIQTAVESFVVGLSPILFNIEHIRPFWRR
jgi:hypothetical protein